MTQEEKAKAYDEALKVLHKYDGVNIMFSQSLKEEMFPELKESEDERIRKFLINVFENNDEVPCGEFNNKEIIAWLEKQGDKGKLIQELGEYKVKYTQEVLGKHLKTINKDDERLRNTTIAFLKDFAEQGYENAVECIDWLEKHEQKPADKVESKFKNGDWVVYDHRPYQVVELPKEGYINLGLRGNGKIVYAPSTYCRHWTIQDARDGDVLSWDDSKCITLFKNIYDEDSFNSYGFVGHCTDTFESRQSYHDIKGAHPTSKEQRDLLFQKMKEAGYEWDAEKKELKKIEQKPAEDVDLPEFESHLCLMFQKFRTKGMCTNGEIIDYVKEHSQKLRDILVKPAWSEEDDEHLERILKELESQYQKPINRPYLDKIESDYNWLKSLKDRVQSQNGYKPYKRIKPITRV